MNSVPAVLADGKVTDDSSHSHEDGAPPPNASPIYGVACQKVTPDTGAQSTTPAPQEAAPASSVCDDDERPIVSGRAGGTGLHLHQISAT